jgi:PAS domain S-box-containing protein
MGDDTGKSRTKHSGSLHWYHWLVVFFSLLLTICAWYITTLQARQKMEIQFNYQANQITQLVTERMEKYDEALRAGVATIHAQLNGIGLASWRAFSSSLSIEDKYPGINGIGIIHYIKPSELESYLSRVRVLRPDYKIHPAHNKNEYWPITYIEPVDINKKAVGLDMAHEANRHTAAKNARDTGTSQITGPITLVQDAKQTPGFLFYAPFYDVITPPGDIKERQQRFIGIVYAPFIMEKLMEGTLLNENRLVNFNIRDGENLLYDELHQGSEDYDATPLFSASTPVKMYGRLWKFNIQSTEIFREQYKTSQPLMILMGGVIIDSMLLALFLILARSNKKATELAAEMTTEFRLSEAKLSLTIDSMMDGLITMDYQNRVLSTNKAIESLFNVNSDEVVGHSLNVLMTEPYHIEHHSCESDNHENDGITSIGVGREVVGQRKDGSTFPMELAISETMVENQRMFTCIVRDISERKVNERLKSEFVSTVSHELRTPLTSIRGALGLVLGKGNLQLSGKIRKMLEVAHRNSERLTLLINDILDLEKLESGGMDFNYALVDLIALAKNAIEDTDGFARQHQVQLSFTSSLKQAYVYGDAHRLLQVFANLISNATKFSPINSEVEVTVEFNQSSYRVGVRDHGTGIAKDFRDRIFQRFAQADGSDTREKGGTGLGLSICKAIIEHHGGVINYESCVGEGTQFYFDLYIRTAPNATSSADIGACVLICEDDQVTAELLAKIVQSAGVTCDIAETAEAARKMLAANTYRLLLLDLTLPDADGLDLIRECKLEPSTAELPIIVVSASAEEGKKVLNGDAVMVLDWLQKPFDVNTLLQATQQALNPRNCPRILHVEDDPDVVEIARMVLEGQAAVSHARDLEEARKLLGSHTFDLVLLDLELGDGSGAELLDLINKNDTPVIIFSGESPAHQIASQVNKALTKSKTSNEELRKMVYQVLNQKDISNG